MKVHSPAEKLLQRLAEAGYIQFYILAIYADAYSGQAFRDMLAGDHPVLILKE